MEKQQCIILPADMIKQIYNMQLIPIGMVPQKNRRDQMISDYSYFNVNNDTFEIAPLEAMQFGRTLWQLLHRIHHTNSNFGPVYMSKVDLSDGFYHLWLRLEETHCLVVLLTTRKKRTCSYRNTYDKSYGLVVLSSEFSSLYQDSSQLGQ